MNIEIIFSFITLSLLEIVLGIDNLIFIALVVQKLPQNLQNKARYIGLTLALALRVAMMLGIVWIMSLTKPLFTLAHIELSVKDLLLLAGGVFLIVKSTLEMHADIACNHTEKEIRVKQYFLSALIQIILIDLVFSFDSVITAVGMTTEVLVIIAAMTVAMLVMLGASGFISTFLKTHPTFKMLALSFILMIGTLLIAESMHFHVPRGYIYFAFSFSLFVETMNSMIRKSQNPPSPKEKYGQ